VNSEEKVHSLEQKISDLESISPFSDSLREERLMAAHRFNQSTDRKKDV